MMKHTKGPWAIDEGTPGHIKSYSKSHRYIENVGHATPTVARFDIWSSFNCLPDGVGFSKDEELANAHLIASAPELLEALEEILDYRGGATNALLDPYVMERAQAAIAKAKGA